MKLWQALGGDFGDVLLPIGGVTRGEALAFLCLLLVPSLSLLLAVSTILLEEVSEIDSGAVPVTFAWAGGACGGGGTSCCDFL